MRWRWRHGWRRLRLGLTRRALRIRGAGLRRFAALALALGAAVALPAARLAAFSLFWQGVAAQGARLAGASWDRLKEQFTTGLSAEAGRSLLESVLPPAALDRSGPEPPASWRTPLRAWVQRATGYDFSSPRSFFEAEMGGFRRAAAVMRDVVRLPEVGGGKTEGSEEEPFREGAAATEPGAAFEGRNDAGAALEPESGRPAVIPVPAALERLKQAAWGSEPLVLIVHTHTSESYATPVPDPRADAYMHVWNSTDTGITRVGAALARRLQEEYGIGTIHSTRIHDWPNHWEAYNHARRTVEELLRRHPTIAAVFDIHRQGVENMYYAATVSGVEAVQIDILYTTAQNFSYGAHPRWRSNEEFALRLAEAMEFVHPGLLRRTMRVDDRRYNQDLHPRMLLLEVGNYLDLEERAIAAAELLADAVALALAGALAEEAAQTPVEAVTPPQPPRPQVLPRR